MAHAEVVEVKHSVGVPLIGAVWVGVDREEAVERVDTEALGVSGADGKALRESFVLPDAVGVEEAEEDKHRVGEALADWAAEGVAGDAEALFVAIRLGVSRPVLESDCKSLAVGVGASESEGEAEGASVAVLGPDSLAEDVTVGFKDTVALDQPLPVPKWLPVTRAVPAALPEGPTVRLLVADRQKLVEPVADTVEEGVGCTDPEPQPLSDGRPVQLAELEALRAPLALPVGSGDDDTVVVAQEEGAPLADGEAEAERHRVGEPVGEGCAEPETEGDAEALLHCDGAAEMLTHAEGLGALEPLVETLAQAVAEGVEQAEGETVCAELTVRESVAGAVAAPEADGDPEAPTEGEAAAEFEDDRVVLSVYEGLGLLRALPEPLLQGLALRDPRALPLDEGEGELDMDLHPEELGDPEADTTTVLETVAVPRPDTEGLGLAHTVAEGDLERAGEREAAAEAESEGVGDGDAVGRAETEALAAAELERVAAPVPVGAALGVVDPLAEAQGEGEGLRTADLLGVGQAEEVPLPRAVALLLGAPLCEAVERMLPEAAALAQAVPDPEAAEEAEGALELEGDADAQGVGGAEPV